MLERLFISPDERRLRAGWRIAGQFLLLVFFVTVFGISLGWLVGLMRTPSTGMLVEQTIVVLAITASVFIARRWLDRRSITSLGLQTDKYTLLDLIVGIAISGLMMAGIYLFESAVGWVEFEAFSWEQHPVSTVIIEVLLALLFFILVGWGEELLSRGYWLVNFTEGLNLFWGVLISSAIFGLAHMANPNFSWVAIIGLTAAGIFMAYACLRTRQLWLPVGLHIGWNFFQGTVFGFQVSGTGGYNLISHISQGPSIWTGGPFGPEAGLVIFPAMALGAALIYLYTRDRAVIG